MDLGLENGSRSDPNPSLALLYFVCSLESWSNPVLASQTPSAPTDLEIRIQSYADPFQRFGSDLTNTVDSARGLVVLLNSLCFSPLLQNTDAHLLQPMDIDAKR